MCYYLIIYIKLEVLYQGPYLYYVIVLYYMFTTICVRACVCVCVCACHYHNLRRLHSADTDIRLYAMSHIVRTVNQLQLVTKCCNVYHLLQDGLNFTRKRYRPEIIFFFVMFLLHFADLYITLLYVSGSAEGIENIFLLTTVMYSVTCYLLYLIYNGNVGWLF